MIPEVQISDYRTELSLLSGQVGRWVGAVMCLGRGINAEIPDTVNFTSSNRHEDKDEQFSEY